MHRNANNTEAHASQTDLMTINPKPKPMLQIGTKERVSTAWQTHGVFDRVPPHEQTKKMRKSAISSFKLLKESRSWHGHTII